PKTGARRRVACAWHRVRCRPARSRGLPDQLLDRPLTDHDEIPHRDGAAAVGADLQEDISMIVGALDPCSRMTISQRVEAGAVPSRVPGDDYRVATLPQTCQHPRPTVLILDGQAGTLVVDAQMGALYAGGIYHLEPLRPDH